MTPLQIEVESTTPVTARRSRLKSKRSLRSFWMDRGTILERLTVCEKFVKYSVKLDLYTERCSRTTKQSKGRLIRTPMHSNRCNQDQRLLKTRQSVQWHLVRLRRESQSHRRLNKRQVGSVQQLTSKMLSSSSSKLKAGNQSKKTFTVKDKLQKTVAPRSSR